MRHFNYIKEFCGMAIVINSYIKEMKKELQYLIDVENKPMYYHFLETILAFEKKYPNIYEIESGILSDLMSVENVEYYYKNNSYKEDASRIGYFFQKDLYKIFEMEEQLKQIAIEAFIDKMTDFDDIVNGEDFMVVGHASYQLPGLPGDKKYRYNKCFGKHYISCTLLSNLELNIFQDNSIFYLVDVNKENYLSGTYYDVATRECSQPSIYTVGKIEFNGEKSYVDAGYTYDNDKFALSIATPKVIEKMSVERELSENVELYKYTNSLTNEIVLDRDKTSLKGCLLVANETKILFSEFYSLLQNNMKFKCINIGIYKEKRGINRYDVNDLKIFKSELIQTINYWKNILDYDSFVLFLENYYRQVVIPMNYSDEILMIINEEFLKYINTNIIYETKDISSNINKF